VKRLPELASAGGLGAVALLLSGAPAAAAEWSLAPTVALWVDHDTNRDLTSPATSSYGTSLSLDLQMSYRTDRVTLSLRPQALLQHYDSAQFPTSNDGIVQGLASYQSERSDYKLSGMWSDQNLLTTELPSTGIVQPGTRRKDAEVTPSWDYNHSERWSLNLQGTYSDVNYSADGTQPAVALQSYHGFSTSATERFSYSERSALLLTALWSSYTQASEGAPARTVGATAGLKTQLGERTTLVVNAGASSTSLLSHSSSGWLGDFSLTRITQTSTFSFSAQRTVSPQGYGQITRQDAIKLAARREFSERTFADASIDATRYANVFENLAVDLSYLDHTFAQFGAGLGYRYTENWTLAVRGYYNLQDNRTLPDAHGWAVRLESVWTPDPRSMSR
jgi:lipopolysaccharide assembly outer membrane protein LptD (OstA)